MDPADDSEAARGGGAMKGGIEAKVRMSVVVCTHNPDEVRFRRVLEALREQTLGKEEWELLVVDNVSAERLSGRWDLGWHPHGRHVREEEIGLTPARLRGIRETSGELVVWVDDDNVLDRNYLEVAVRLGAQHPSLGMWGGSLRGEFEASVPEWARPYLVYLAVREVERARWGMNHDCGVLPPGAGLVVRREVAEMYASTVKESTFRRMLDRRGSSLASCGDTDMVLTGMDIGYWSAVFPALGMTHLIPAGRLDEGYLLRMVEESSYSFMLLKLVKGLERDGAREGLVRRVKEWMRRVHRQCFRGRHERRFHDAEMRGRRRAVRVFSGAS
jgi:glycosyltransferase involved in cell wall biosynthesis